MKSLSRFVFGLTVASVGIGVIGFQPAALVWAGQATEHDHTHNTGAPPTAAEPRTPAAPDEQKMSQMQQGMMARMSAFDDQIKALGTEMNAAKTTDAKLTAVTKLLNVLIEQRSMMRMQMDKQGKMMEQMMSMHQKMEHMMPASPDGSATQPHGADTNPH
jgi:hypothetical protein